MIRPLSLSDIDDITKIELESFPKTPYSKTTFIYYKTICPDTFLVWENEREIIAYIIFDKRGHIISMAVKKENRRNKIGTKLVEKVFKKSKEKARVEVREGNIVAQKFYKKLGFSEVSKILDYYGNEDALVMKR